MIREQCGSNEKGLGCSSDNIETAIGEEKISMNTSKVKKWIIENKGILMKLIAVAFPMVIQGIVFELQLLTDKAFLGRVDDVYIAAAGAIQFPVGATSAFLMALSTGTTIIVSRLFGVGKQEEMLATVKSSIFYNSLLSFLVFCLWFFGGGAVMRLMSVDELLIPDCVACLRIYAFFFLILGLDSSLQAMLQGMGKTKPILYAGLIRVFFNILISWLLILGKFGLPALNVVGAAVGTLAADIISTGMLVIYCFFMKNKEYHLLSHNHLWFDFRAYKASFFLGIPTALEYLLWNVSNLVLVRFLNGFSYVATEIYTLTFGVEVMVVAVFSGNSKACMALMGQRIGAEKKRDANRIFYVCMAFSLVLVLLFATVFALFPAPLLDIFSDEAGIIQKGIPFMMFTGAILILKSINVMVGSAIRAYSDTKWMLYSQMIGSIFVVTFSFLLVKAFGLGIAAIYLTLFSDELIRAILNFIRFQVKYSNHAQLQEEQKKPA